MKASLQQKGVRKTPADYSNGSLNAYLNIPQTMKE